MAAPTPEELRAQIADGSVSPSFRDAVEMLARLIEHAHRREVVIRWETLEVGVEPDPLRREHIIHLSVRAAPL